MLLTKFTSTALVASLALFPATQVAADGKDFIVGAVIGGVVGSQLQKQKQRERYAAPVATRNYVAPAPTRTYRSSIPATQDGRQIQSSLNYFGFDAGRVDGQVGGQTRDAIEDYQAYLGYPSTGTLNAFEQDLLTGSYNRALAGGDQTVRQIAAQPDGTRGLLKLYRSEIASGDAAASGTFSNGG